MKDLRLRKKNLLVASPLRRLFVASSSFLIILSPLPILQGLRSRGGSGDG